MFTVFLLVKVFLLSGEIALINTHHIIISIIVIRLLITMVWLCLRAIDAYFVFGITV